MDDTLERSTMRKVYLRLLPFAILSYVLAYIDRINVSFAGLTMRGDLGMSAGTFGLRRRHVLLGLFYLRGPEQRDLGKGRRQNMDRPDHDHLGSSGRPDCHGYGFDELRDRTLPAWRRRGRVLSRHHPLLHLLVSEPSSRPHRVRLSGRTSGRGGGRCADIDGASWPGRLVRPAGLASHVHRRSNSNRGDRGDHILRAHRSASAEAKFLTAEERNWLVTTIAAERRATEAVRKLTLWQALYNPKVLLLALNYLGIVTASLGMLIFIPQMIKSLGDYWRDDRGRPLAGA